MDETNKREEKQTGTAGMDQAEKISSGKTSQAVGKPSQAEGDREEIEQDIQEKLGKQQSGQDRQQ
ncbi:MAG TPA: hypothetical protein VH186_07250 [Chloroflexia bacterium]|nr:hypothetical protein [Chloroflexia bacterium]